LKPVVKVLVRMAAIEAVAAVEKTVDSAREAVAAQ
jgi:hypothetical protein